MCVCNESECAGVKIIAGYKWCLPCLLGLEIISNGGCHPIPYIHTYIHTLIHMYTLVDFGEELIHLEMYDLTNLDSASNKI